MRCFYDDNNNNNNDNNNDNNKDLFKCAQASGSSLKISILILHFHKCLGAGAIKENLSDTIDLTHSFIEAVVPYVHIDMCMLPQLPILYPKLVATTHSHNSSRRLKVQSICMKMNASFRFPHISYAFSRWMQVNT